MKTNETNKHITYNDKDSNRGLTIKIQRKFAHSLLPIVLETTNSRTQGSLHFVEITNTGTNEQKYFHVM
jgi:hypothetical protein